MKLDKIRIMQAGNEEVVDDFFVARLFLYWSLFGRVEYFSAIP